MRSLNTFISIHKTAKDALRLGQRFCNMYMKQPFPELYYEENDDKAAFMIRSYLTDYCYFETLPIILTENNKK